MNENEQLDKRIENTLFYVSLFTYSYFYQAADQSTAARFDLIRSVLERREPGVVTPYQRAALAALRELTGRDTAPTAKAWRQLLQLVQHEDTRPPMVEGSLVP